MKSETQRKTKVAKLLIPAKRRRGPRLPLTLATFLVPLLGLFILLNIAPVRSPLGGNASGTPKRARITCSLA